MTTRISHPFESGSAPCLLAVKDISVGYGKAPVLRNFSMHITSGSTIALVGPNGAGKTTLLKCISGLLKVKQGSIELSGNSISGLPASVIARKGVLHVPENRDIFGGMTIWENLKIAFDNLDSKGDETTAFHRVYTLFPILKERQNQIAGNLSGGQQQMLAIGRALLGKPTLLMLDEPSLGLAGIITDSIYESLKTLRDEGLSILLVEQDVRRAIQFADYIFVLVHGKIVLEGTRDQLMENDELVHHYLGGS
ncbi:MAG: ABC transporter ATP-binding protein [Burkholderiaceae bacterium]|nr:ABC transporter ATP-binding protein [Burkholderiaceae bacterium]